MQNAKTFVIKNILPGFAVMVLGLFSAYFVYSTYYKGDADALKVVYIEPAAGEEKGKFLRGAFEENGITYFPVDIDNIPHH